MRKKILYLTDLDNGSQEEDLYLSSVLSNNFDITISHPLLCEKYLDEVDGILIRNVWPVIHHSLDEWKRIKSIIEFKKIRTYNPLSGKGDNLGKHYLLDLHKHNFPVIPSIDDVTNVNELGENKFYWIKPVQGCDGYGAKKVTKSVLQKLAPKDYIIQPYMEFTSEPSFFFIDNIFLYAISTTHRLKENDIKLYQPTDEELAFAEKFVQWNNIPYGIQRIDAIKTKSGKLLLTEVEDIAEYLYLLDLDQLTREKIVGSVEESLLNFFE